MATACHGRTTCRARSARVRITAPEVPTPTGRVVVALEDTADPCRRDGKRRAGREPSRIGRLREVQKQARAVSHGAGARDATSPPTMVRTASWPRGRAPRHPIRDEPRPCDDGGRPLATPEGCRGPAWFAVAGAAGSRRTPGRRVPTMARRCSCRRRGVHLDVPHGATRPALPAYRVD